jgi:ABC-type polysaccharide/polyol phosphate transport system ATPase subunit
LAYGSIDGSLIGWPSMSEPVIACTHVTKAFRVPVGGEQTLRGRVLHPRNRARHEEFVAVSDVTFSITEGEFFGIVGRNGSGKSTLLKLLAGIYRLDEGSIEINGSIAPFIELGVGFNDELSARDNVYVNGAIMGLSRRQLQSMYPRIVEFAELDGFMDMKLRNFSSGMLMRLAFAIAVQADADILLVDEVLAVGDERFQRKCQDVFRERRRRGQTVVFVSHDMSAIEAFCDRVLVLDKGVTAALGAAHDVVPVYHRLNRDDDDLMTTVEPAPAPEPDPKPEPEPEPEPDSLSSELDRPSAHHKRPSFIELDWLGALSSRRARIDANDSLPLRVAIDLSPHLHMPRARLLVLNEAGAIVGEINIEIEEVPGSRELPLTVEIVNCLTAGRYRIIAELHALLEDGRSVLADANDVELDVIGESGVGSTRFTYSATRAIVEA